MGPGPLMRTAFYRPLAHWGLCEPGWRCGVTNLALSEQCKWRFRGLQVHSNVASVEVLSSRQMGQVAVFVDLLLEWNQRMNLTAVIERGAMMDRHITDSLALLPSIEGAYSSRCTVSEGESLKVIDIGSGAGLPGLVLAIARPAWQVTLLESLQKRCDFLEHVAQSAGLTNVQVLRMRAEEHIDINPTVVAINHVLANLRIVRVAQLALVYKVAGRGRMQDTGKDGVHREAYDVAVARAVAEMRVLAELCLPLVRVGGILVAAKGPNPYEEVEAAKAAVDLLGASIISICTVESQGPLGQRTAVVCLKQRATPPKYPRRTGMPSKRPL